MIEPEPTVEKSSISNSLFKEKNPFAPKKTEVQRTLSIPTSIHAAKKSFGEKALQIDLDEKESKERSEENTSQLAEIFDYDKLKSVIQEIIEDLKSQHKTLEVTVLKQSFILEGETVTYHLNGEIQQDIFLKIKNDILGILRRKLNNYSIHLESEIKEDEESDKKKLYTSTDKLHYLLEKSPALAELKKRFGLETDF